MPQTKLLVVVAVAFAFLGCNELEVQQSLADVPSPQARSISPSIAFLTQDKGALAIVDETVEPFFAQLQLREIEAFVGEKPPAATLEQARQFARNRFANAVTEFSEEEIACIRFTVTRISELLRKHNLNLVADAPWQFIKTEAWLCGGFAFTRGDYIVLSQKHLDKLMASWHKDMSQEDIDKLVTGFGGLLAHEHFHSIQRHYPERFEKLYRDYWTFEKVDAKLDDSQLIDQLTNPDAPKPEWAFRDSKSLYWVRTMIRPESAAPVMGRDFMDVVFLLEESHDGYSLKTDSIGVLAQTNLSELACYSQRFPVSRGLDHPNEISAYMFSDYFTALYSDTEPFAGVDAKARITCDRYVEWLAQHLN